MDVWLTCANPKCGKIFSVPRHVYNKKLKSKIINKIDNDDFLCSRACTPEYHKHLYDTESRRLNQGYTYCRTVEDFKNKLKSYSIKDERGCMVWQKARDKDGYGITNFKNVWGKAHIKSYELFKGTIPKGLQVCHSCDNPPCINPDHLFLDTPKGNTEDMVRKGRQAKGEASYHSKLTEEQVKEIRRLYGLNDSNLNKFNPSKAYPYSYLAKLFNVCEGAVSCIITRRSWKHIP